MSQFRKPRIKPAPKAHPLVRELFRIMSEEECGIVELCKRTGISDQALKDWRTRSTPRTDMLEACLNALGYRLAIVDAGHHEAGEPGRQARSAIAQSEIAAYAAYIEGRGSSPPEYALPPALSRMYAILSTGRPVTWEAVLRESGAPSRKTASVQITNLRKKLKPFGWVIRSIHSFGFHMERVAAPALEVAA